jgi:hypothetical protein
MGFRWAGCLFAVVILVSFWAPVSASAQSPSSQQPEPPQIGQAGEPIPHDLTNRMAKERLKSRYHDLKRDSEKLLELATELKQYVDKSGESVLSMDVIRKCEEIEKLSKSVRSKMKGE